MHKERNLSAQAPKRLHDEIKAEYSAMIHSGDTAQVLAKRRALLRKWRLKCPMVLSEPS